MRALELPALIAVPVLLVVCALLRINQTAVLTLVVVVGALVIFFASFEYSRPGLRQIMPTIVLASLAAAGRILFAAVPSFKPVSAICIVAGLVFGRRTGFMVGALAALASNFFFGHGPWTPWQMYAWGLIGYGAGVLADWGAFGRTGKKRNRGMRNACDPSPLVPVSHKKAEPASAASMQLEPGSISAMKPKTAESGTARGSAEDETVSAERTDVSRETSPHKSSKWSPHQLFLYLYGFASALVYGIILNTWHVVGFVQPTSIETVLVAYAASLPFDITHGIATAAFLLIIYAPWRKKLERIKRKYDLQTTR